MMNSFSINITTDGYLLTSASGLVLAQSRGSEGVDMNRQSGDATECEEWMG